MTKKQQVTIHTLRYQVYLQISNSKMSSSNSEGKLRLFKTETILLSQGIKTIRTTQTQLYNHNTKLTTLYSLKYQLNF